MRFLKRVTRNVPRMVVKVYVHFESLHSPLDWKKADKWFITPAECENIYRLLSTIDGEVTPLRYSEHVCSVCLENLIERRIPQCGVRCK